MKYLKPLVGSAILIGLMLAASAWAWPRLGEQPIPVHFGLDGQPNGFARKNVALILMPGAALGVAILLTILPPGMPHRARIERSWGPYVTVWLAMLAFLLAIHLTLIATALGMHPPISRVTLVGLGLLFAVLGNLLGKVRYNYVFGVRTPWTLADERVWDRTHRFAGWAMALGGMIAVCIGLLAPAALEPQLHFVSLVCVIAPAAAAVVYSYFESRRLERGAA